MTCATPAFGKVGCVMPNGDKALYEELSEADGKGIFHLCGQPWKWAWQDTLNGGVLYAQDTTALASYENNHPLIPHSAL
jgi:hypothetical protein